MTKGVFYVLQKISGIFACLFALAYFLLQEWRGGRE
jgi:hypothetical protein